MKKFIAFLVVLVALLSFSACGEKVDRNFTGDQSDNTGKTENSKVETSFTIGVVDGAPSLAVANILKGFDFSRSSDGVDYIYHTNVSVVSGAQDVRAGVLNGTFDMAITPLNMSAAISNAKPELGLKLAAVNVFGCIYVIGEDDISGFSDFKGKTVISVGAGGTPDVVFRNLVSKSNVGINLLNGNDPADEEKVNLTFADDASGVVAALKNGAADFAILGEPAVTTVCKVTGKKVVMNIQEEWSKVYTDLEFVQAGLCMSNKVYTDTNYVDALLLKLGENKKYVYDNISSLNDIYEEVQSSLKSVAFSAELLDRCNIGMKRASEIKEDIEAFLTAVYDFNPQQVGGSLPDESFYY